MSADVPMPMKITGRDDNYVTVEVDVTEWVRREVVAALLAAVDEQVAVRLVEELGRRGYLDAHDREVAAKALEEAAEEFARTVGQPHNPEHAVLGLDMQTGVVTDVQTWLRTRARRYACDTGTVERPCQGCPDCQAGAAVSFGEGR